MRTDETVHSFGDSWSVQRVPRAEWKADGKGNAFLRNGSSDPRDAITIGAQLRTILTAATTHEVTDAYGTYTAVAVSESSWIDARSYTGAGIAQLTMQEV